MVKKYIKPIIAIIVIVLALVVSIVIIRSCEERLPGHDMENVDRSDYVDKEGKTVEYFTGQIVEFDKSILGPKITVKKDRNNQNRTFFLERNAEVWLGLEEVGSSIKGQEKVESSEIEVGQRVACFVNNKNKCYRIHILKR